MKFINPQQWKSPKGYNNGVLCPPGGSILFIAGQVGWDEQEVMQEGFVNQFRRALWNVVAIVEEAGGKASDIVRLTMYITDRKLYLDNLQEVGKAYRSVIGKHYPAMAMVEVNALMEADAMVEIEGTAVVRNSFSMKDEISA